MRCVICGSPKHSAENCDRFKRPEMKQRCPGCRHLVTAEERELHREHGCAAYNQATVSHDSSRTG
jgi:hypothetical protein